MKHLISYLIVLVFFETIGFSQIKKVELSYNQQEVYVVLDDHLLGMNPAYIKVNFDINKDLYFYKKGYYSQRLEIDPDEAFAKLTIDLKPKNTEVGKLEQKKMLKLDTLKVSRIVTNFTASDLQEIIDKNFMENNYFIGKESSLFSEAAGAINSSKYKLGIEIVDSKQIRSVYKAPRFMMAQIQIRWSLLDTDQKKIVYFHETEGSYFVQMQQKKGFVVSEIMERVMEGAIEEAELKLLTDEKFVGIIKSE